MGSKKATHEFPGESSLPCRGVAHARDVGKELIQRQRISFTVITKKATLTDT